MNRRTIIVTETDVHRLRALLAGQVTTSAQDHVHLRDLRSELDRAVVVDGCDVPGDVVTMNARVRLHDVATDTVSEYTVVFPSHADLAKKRLSVLAPLGTALLGYREGDEVEWQMPGGPRRLRIVEVRHAPDARWRRAGTGAVAAANAPAAA